MLKLALASLVVLTATQAFAQTAPSPQQQPQTLVEPGAPLRMTGWYLAPTFALTSIDGARGYLPGVRGAFMLNNRLGVGFALNFMGTDQTRLKEDDVRQVGAYGGAYAQYVFRSSDKLHVYADATIGEGNWCQQSTSGDCDDRKFVFLEPTANVEVNITKNVRLAAGLGYRLAVAERQGPTDSRDDMAGFVARTSLVVGAF